MCIRIRGEGTAHFTWNNPPNIVRMSSTALGRLWLVTSALRLAGMGIDRNESGAQLHRYKRQPHNLARQSRRAHLCTRPTSRHHPGKPQHRYRHSDGAAVPGPH